jgi:ribosomal protein RSM22 (predicted rRNA methylase)
MNGTDFSSVLCQAILACAGEINSSAAEGVRGLSSLFTVARDHLGQDYLADPILRRAYMLYFLPVNQAKAKSVLAEIPPPPQRPLRLLDLGCGPGAGSLAFLEYLSTIGVRNPGIDLLAIDRSRDALRDLEALWTDVCGTLQFAFAPRLQLQTLDLERPGRDAPWKRTLFDIIVVSNVLNELFRDKQDATGRRMKLIGQLLDALAPDGSLILIEPALRETTRSLHEMRDQLLVLGKATVYSPCLHERPCPALVNPEDWCHEERPWSPPAFVAEIDREVGFIKDALKFSYVVMRKDGRTIVERGSDVYRVVSERMAMKGEQRVWLCNEQGRQLVGRLEKERSVTNAAFDRWDRGSIVLVDEIDRKGAVGRIREDATVELITPSRP